MRCTNPFMRSALAAFYLSVESDLRYVDLQLIGNTCATLIYPAKTLATCIFFEFWLVYCTVHCYYWPGNYSVFGFTHGRVKTALTDRTNSTTCLFFQFRSMKSFVLQCLSVHASLMKMRNLRSSCKENSSLTFAVTVLWWIP